MGKQPELPEFVRDLEIVHTLNRMMSATAGDPLPDPDETDETDETDESVDHAISN